MITGVIRPILVTALAIYVGAELYPAQDTSNASGPSDTDPVATEYAEFEALCGAHSLFLICDYHHMGLSYEDVLRLVPPPTELGVSMLSLKQVAEQIGFDVRALEIEPLALTKFRDPMIARGTFLNRDSAHGHFVVLLPDTAATPPACWVFDPSRPWAKASRHEIVKPADGDADTGTIHVLILRPKSEPSDQSHTGQRHEAETNTVPNGSTPAADRAETKSHEFAPNTPISSSQRRSSF